MCSDMADVVFYFLHRLYSNGVSFASHAAERASTCWSIDPTRLCVE